MSRLLLLNSSCMFQFHQLVVPASSSGNAPVSSDMPWKQLKLTRHLISGRCLRRNLCSLANMDEVRAAVSMAGIDLTRCRQPPPKSVAGRLRFTNTGTCVRCTRWPGSSHAHRLHTRLLRACGKTSCLQALTRALVRKARVPYEILNVVHRSWLRFGAMG